MKRTSLKRRPVKETPTEGYPDCHGIEFADVQYYLPGKVSDWPQVVRVVDHEVERMMHEWHGTCWACNNWYPLDPEAHHITGGTKGRSDEYTNLAMLCRSCHENANTAKLPMGRILFLKHKFDKQHTDWVRLSLLARRLLPDLITG